MNHQAEPLSTSESRFILSAAASGLRVDGRKTLEPRAVAVSFGADQNATFASQGSVQVRMGETKVLAVATAELIEPYPDRPTEGALQFFVELSPMASQAFEPGRPSEAAVELMRLLDRALRKSQAIDVESLCVVASKHVWSIRCDVTVLDHGGNITDACLLAALAALKHLRLPSVTVSGAGEEARVRVLPPEQAERQPLVFHHTPVAVTLAFLPSQPAAAAQAGGSGSAGGGGGDGDGSGGGLAYVLDPTEREEMVMVGTLTVVLNQHQELCALHTAGTPVAPAQLMQCVASASAVAPKHLILLEKVLHAHGLKLAEAAEILRRTGRVANARPATNDSGMVLSSAVATGAVATAPQGEAAGALGVAPAPSAGAGKASDEAPTAAATKKKKKKKKRAREQDDDEEETVTVRSAFA